MFDKESLSGFHDFRQKVVVELTAGGKNFTKIANIPMHKHNQTQTQLHWWVWVTHRSWQFHDPDLFVALFFLPSWLQKWAKIIFLVILVFFLSSLLILIDSQLKF